LDVISSITNWGIANLSIVETIIETIVETIIDTIVEIIIDTIVNCISIPCVDLSSWAGYA
jgi:hypothetical protein